MKIVLSILIASILTLAWSWFHLSDAQRQAEAALQSERIVEELSHKIALLKDKPKKAMTLEVAITELSSRIESLAQTGGISKESLVLIQPEAARETQGSQYLEKPTRVEFEKVDLPKLVHFLTSVSEGNGDLYCDSLRIKAPPGDPLGSTWDAEFTLSYLVLKPDAKNEQ